MKRSKLKLGVYSLLTALTIGISASPFTSNPNSVNQVLAANKKQNKHNKKTKKAKKAKTTKAQKLEEKRLAEDPVYKSYKKYGITYKMSQKAKSMPITAIGDSVMLGSQYGFEEIFPNIKMDASVSRQAYEGADLIKQAEQNGTLQKNIVISLGTNGTITRDDIKEVLTAAGKNRRIFWITNDVQQPWEKGNNKELKKAAKKHKNFHLIDWKKLATNKGDETWFSEDGIHPSVKGQEHYYTLVAKTVLKTK